MAPSGGGDDASRPPDLRNVNMEDIQKEKGSRMVGDLDYVSRNPKKLKTDVQ